LPLWLGGVKIAAAKNGLQPGGLVNSMPSHAVAGWHGQSRAL